VDTRVAVECIVGAEHHAGAAEDPADGAVGGVADQGGEGALVGGEGAALGALVGDGVRDFMAGAGYVVGGVIGVGAVWLRGSEVAVEMMARRMMRRAGMSFTMLGVDVFAINVVSRKLMLKDDGKRLRRLLTRFEAREASNL
jgi:hypothetical protein